ncbi:MAG TPA: 4-hydroxythreonine-4-phosphate dehydrogenase PdxA [Paracoccaceae bacterium]|nr:4-hydroxythreonine-4-phosphate dehydrogenase PdxA [Paracoccaceae bacterium]
MNRLPIALTCGEPAGVGPEITVKAWQELRGATPFFLISDVNAMRPIAAAYDVEVEEISDPADAVIVSASHLPVLHQPLPDGIQSGNLSADNAPSVVQSIKSAVSFTKSGQALAVCTNPINKHALKAGAGFAFPGHTEFLESLSGTEAKAVMMLAAPELKVVPLTIHIPLADVAKAVTAELLEITIKTTHTALQNDFGIAAPRIAVAGLNPHAGENGAMGREEIELITPTLERLRAAGISLLGPLPADTMFHEPARAKYDVAICMYHDQALIPIKTLNFSAGVNVTIGLPFVRTSPDHGTALDIAGQGLADPTSLIEALKLAQILGENRRARNEH